MPRTPESIAGVADRSLDGATVLVTGSTHGIGRDMAISLGRLGARVIVHGRDRDRGERVVAALEETAAPAARLFIADFTDQTAVRELAASVRDWAGAVDVLCNNAGGYFRSTSLTDDGIEVSIAVNHLAPFILTTELLPALRDSPVGRVVTTSSGAHRGARIDVDSFESADRSGWAAYSQSKLANILFTRELARRVPEIDAYAFHPGFVPGSGFLRDLPGPVATLIKGVTVLPGLGRSTARGAATGVYLAAAATIAGESGDYFVDCERQAPAPAARDEATARRLWTVSERLAGVDGPASTQP